MFLKSKKRAELEDLESLIFQVGEIILHMEAGQTFTQSLQNKERVYCRKEIISEWCQLKDSIENDSSGALSKVQAFQKRLQLEFQAKHKLEKTTKAPRIQLYVLNALIFIFSLTSLIFFPQEFKPSRDILLFVLLLACLSFYLSKKFLNSFQKGLWFFDWMLGLAKTHVAIENGRTLASATIQSFDNFKGPQLLEQYLELFLTELKTHEIIDGENFNIQTHDKLLKRSLLQLSQIRKLFIENLSALNSLETINHRNQEVLSSYFETEAEKLGFKLLVPLFACLLPAFFLLLFGPVLTQLK